MLDREKTASNGATELPEVRRARQAAEDVATWEAAFAATKRPAEAAPARDADHANAGALVSRAHREEKTSGTPPLPMGPHEWPAHRAE